MFACAEQALDRFLPPDAHVHSQGRLRVLLTRVKLGFPQPILWPETRSRFGSQESAKSEGRSELESAAHCRTSLLRVSASDVRF